MRALNNRQSQHQRQTKANDERFRHTSQSLKQEHLGRFKMLPWSMSFACLRRPFCPPLPKNPNLQTSLAALPRRSRHSANEGNDEEEENYLWHPRKHSEWDCLACCYSGHCIYCRAAAVAADVGVDRLNRPHCCCPHCHCRCCSVVVGVTVASRSSSSSSCCCPPQGHLLQQLSVSSSDSFLTVTLVVVSVVVLVVFLRESQQQEEQQVLLLCYCCGLQWTSLHHHVLLVLLILTTTRMQ